MPPMAKREGRGGVGVEKGRRVSYWDLRRLQEISFAFNSIERMDKSVWTNFFRGSRR